MHVRAMTDADLEKVLRIERVNYPNPWSKRIFRDCLTANYYCASLENEGDICGYLIAMSALDEVNLLNICVSANSQRQGYARLLLTSLLQYVHQNAIQKIFLEVRQSNLPAQHLYQSIGFYQVGIREAYYPTQEGREDALVMVLDIKN